MTPEKLLENLYAIAYSLPEQERRFFCALEPAIDPNTHGEINAGHQLALLVRAIRTDMAQQYKRDDKRRPAVPRLRRLCICLCQIPAGLPAGTAPQNKP